MNINIGPHTISLSTDVDNFGGEVTYNGIKFPSSKFWNLVLTGIRKGEPQDQRALVAEARRAAIYSTKLMKSYIFTRHPKPEYIEVVPDLYERWEPVVPRPVLDNIGGTLVYIDKSFSDEEWYGDEGASCKYIIEGMEEHTGYTLWGQLERRMFFIPGGYVEAMEWNNSEELRAAHLLRDKIAFKRPGNTPVQLDLRDTAPQLTAFNDGTIAVTSQVDRVLQGTFMTYNGHVFKGIIRPPLEGEAEFRTSHSNTKQCVYAAEMEGVFHVLAQPGAENFVLDYQAIITTVENPEKLIEWETLGREAVHVRDTLSKEKKAKADAGVPLGLLVDEFSYADITRFRYPGARAVALGSDIVKPETFKLLPDTCSRLNKSMRLHGIRKDIEVGDLFYIYRSPALADATSMYPIMYDGEVGYGEVSSLLLASPEEGVVLNPTDEGWSRAGGDFDGDSAVVMPAGSFDLQSVVERRSYKRASTELRTNPREVALHDVQNPMPGLIGAVTSTMMKLLERGVADDKTCSLGATLAQATVDAKKHEVDSTAFNQGFAWLQARVQLYQGVSGDYYYSLLNDVKRANPGPDRMAAWERVMTMELSDPSPVEKAMMHRVQVFDELFHDINYFRSEEHPELPELMKRRARELMADIPTKNLPGEMLDKIISTDEELTRMNYRIFTNNMEDESTSVLDELREQRRILECRLKLYVYRAGRAGEMCAVQFLPARMAVDLVSAEVFAELTTGVTETILNICDTNWTDGVHPTAGMHAIPNCQSDWESVVGDAEQVEIKVLKKTKRSTRVHLKVM